jgi:hypothetical protein
MGHTGWRLARGWQRSALFQIALLRSVPVPRVRRRHQGPHLAEDLDAYRKRQQAAHPRPTLTLMYNVLEKLWAGEPLDDADTAIKGAGLGTRELKGVTRCLERVAGGPRSAHGLF